LSLKCVCIHHNCFRVKGIIQPKKENSLLKICKQRSVCKADMLDLYVEKYGWKARFSVNMKGLLNNNLIYGWTTRIYFLTEWSYGFSRIFFWKCHLPLKLFQTCMCFFLLLNTKEDILKNVGNQTVDSSHWRQLYLFSYYGSQWLQSTVWLPTCLEISSSCSKPVSYVSLSSVGHKRRWVSDDKMLNGRTLSLTFSIHFRCMEKSCLVCTHSKKSNFYFTEAWKPALKLHMGE